MAERRLRLGLVAACAFPAPRGSQILIDEMAVALARLGAEVHLVAPVDPEAPPRPYHRHPLSRVRRVRPGTRVRGVGLLARPLFDLALVARLASVTRRERLDVLHAHNYEGLFAALLVRRVCGVPVVYHSHNVAADELPLYAPKPLRGWARRLGDRLDATLPARADRVVVLSRDVGEYLAARGVERGRISVIPPGLDPGPFQGLGAVPRERRAVFAGNLDGYQNVELLLDAWRLASEADGGLRLSLVTHERRAALLGALRERGLERRVRVVEARDVGDVARELRSALVGISPRISWSGFPIKTLNYMASGLPTIALAGSAKGVRHGETGWVVADARPEALAEALVASLGRPEACRERGRAAARALRAEHAWERIAPRVLGVARAALAGRAVAASAAAEKFALHRGVETR